jgi:hypothetical protein
LNQLEAYSALAERGYRVQLEEEKEGWTPRDPVRRLSVNIFLDRYRGADSMIPYS